MSNCRHAAESAKFSLMMGLNALLFMTAATADAAISVTNTLDAGPGSLRQALLDANANAGQDTIDLSAILGATPVSIPLQSGLPTITDSLVLDGSIAETRPSLLSEGITKRPGLELNMSAANIPVTKFGPLGPLPYYPNALTVWGPNASHSEITGLIINGMNGSTSGFFTCQYVVFNPHPDSTPANQFPELERCGTAILVFAANYVDIKGNYINLDENGELALIPGDQGAQGIVMYDSSNSVIGGHSKDDRNVITHDRPLLGFDISFGIFWHLTGWGNVAFADIGGADTKANSNQVVGNYVGLTAEGASLHPLSRGISIMSSDLQDDAFFFPGQVGWGPQCATSDPNVSGHCEMNDNVIEGNVLTAGLGPPVIETFGYSRRTRIAKNRVFNTFPDPLLNGSGRYVEVVTPSRLGFTSPEPSAVVDLVISDNKFGLDLNDEPSGAAFGGVVVFSSKSVLVEHNVITGVALGGAVAVLDTGPGGDSPARNVSITRNTIFNNNVLGLPTFAAIDLGFEGSITPNEQGVTLNDFQDLDVGGNDLQNYPVLNWAKEWQGQIRVHGHLNSGPNKRYRIEFFANDILTRSGHGEGQRFLGHVEVETNGGGNTNSDTRGGFDVEIGGALVKRGDYITSTATEICTPDMPDPGDCPHGLANTSEFSAAVQVTQ